MSGERSEIATGREVVSMEDKEKVHCLEKGRGIDTWSLKHIPLTFVVSCY